MLKTPSSLQQCSSSPISRRLGSAESVVLPVPDRPNSSEEPFTYAGFWQARGRGSALLVCTDGVCSASLHEHDWSTAARSWMTYRTAAWSSRWPRTSPMRQITRNRDRGRGMLRDLRSDPCLSDHDGRPRHRRWPRRSEHRARSRATRIARDRRRHELGVRRARRRIRGRPGARRHAATTSTGDP